MLKKSCNIFFSCQSADNSKDAIAPCFGSSTDGKRESETKCEFQKLTRILEHERRSRWRGGREEGEPRCNFSFDFEIPGKGRRVLKCDKNDTILAANRQNRIVEEEHNIWLIYF